RGGRTHTVSTASGWFSSVTCAVVRLDSAAGAIALRELMVGSAAPTRVIAIGQEAQDPTVKDQLSELCRRCGAHHEVSLMWYPPMNDVGAGSPADADGVPAAELAATVADEVSRRTTGIVRP